MFANRLVIKLKDPVQLLKNGSYYLPMLFNNNNNRNQLLSSEIKSRQNDLESKRIQSELIKISKDDRVQQVILNRSPRFLEPYLKLMRLDKPAPVLLVYWPSAWAILGAASYQHAILPDFYMLAIFALGALAMRASGCIINDIWDRKLDAKVERTKDRPLASGQIGLPSALILLGGSLSASLSILLQLNLTTQVLGACCLFPVGIYPAAKRFTNWPQAILGVTFNWGALMGWSAIICSQVSAAQSIFTFLPAVVLYAGCINWTLFYDTIYAFQDKDYDVRLGLKSTALHLQNNPRLWLLGFSAAATTNLALFGYLTNQEPVFYITLGLAAAHFLKQIVFVNLKSPASCNKQFKSNNTIGALISFGLLASIFIK